MNRIVKLCGYSIIALAPSGGLTARADAIKTWSGASASVWGPGSSSAWPSDPPTTGAVAAGSFQGSSPVTYLGVNYSGGPLPSFTVTVHGSADAQATGRANDLLRAGATYFTPNPGTRPQVIQGTDSVLATASWTGDRAQLQGPVPLGTLRLNFSVGLVGPNYQFGSFGGVVVEANNHTMTLTNHFLQVQPFFQQGFDSLTTMTAAGPPYSNHYQATFHLDLPVNSSGLSDPFRLSLQVTPDSGLESNYAINSGPIGDAILSLTSITTTDGRLLSDLGDTVTFASGMLAPGVQPVPEPSSILIIGGLVAAVGLGRRFHRGSRSSRMVD